MRRVLLASVIGASLFGSHTAAYAAACGTATFDTYLASGFTCTEGDKTFSNFSYIAVGNTSGQTPPASAINVVPIANPLTTFGFTFDGIWSAPVPGAIAHSFLDYTLTTGAGFRITAADLSVAGSASGSGAFSSVTDTYSAPFVGGSNLHTAQGGGATAHWNFATPQTSVTVQEDIEAFAGAGMAELSSVTDTQTVVGVPEPSTWAMMLIGFAGLGFAFRQSRRRVSFG
jgi:hypothetical protein